MYCPIITHGIKLKRKHVSTFPKNWAIHMLEIRSIHSVSIAEKSKAFSSSSSSETLQGLIVKWKKFKDYKVHIVTSQKE
jgi:hypothetical protein